MTNPSITAGTGVASGMNELSSNPGVGAQAYVRTLTQLYGFAPKIPDPAKAPRDDPSFWRKALRDVTVRKAVMKRTYAVAGKRWTVQPGEEGVPEDQVAASILEGALRKIRLFDHARALLASAIFRGSSYAYIQGRRVFCSLGRDANGVRLQPMWWWIPTELVDVDPYRFELRRDPTDNVIKWYMGSVASSPRKTNGAAAFDEWAPLEHPEWFCRHVYEPTEQSLRYGQGLQDTLEFPLWAKQDLWRNFLAGARRAGRGFLKVKTNDVRAGSTTEENEERIQDWKDVLEIVREDGDLICSPEDEVELMDVPLDGLEIIRAAIREINDDMTGLILFGVLPTGAGSGGSNARAEEEGSQGREAFEFDQSGLSESITEGVVRLVWNLNRANFAALGLAGANMGRFEIVNESKPDPKSMAAVVATLMAAGASLRLDEVLERCGGWTPPKPGQPILARPVASPQLPFGDDPKSTAQDDPLSQDVTRGGVEPGAEPPAGAPPERPTVARARAAVERLRSRAKTASPAEVLAMVDDVRREIRRLAG